MTIMGKLLATAAVVALFSVVPASAQICNDFDECTTPDMCADGICAGTPVSGGSCDDGRECTGPDTCAAGECTGAPLSGGECDDGSACTVDDTCVSGQCQGTPVENGTACGVGGNTECGVCMTGACISNPAKQGQSCTDVLGNCTTNDVCIGTICLGTFITCPDLDSNKCTAEVCLPFMSGGTCSTVGPVPCGTCTSCDSATGGCVPDDEGMPCDDTNVCNGSGTCSAGACQLGAPGTPTFTPTGTPVGTVSATATVTPEGPLNTPTATDTPELTPLSTATSTPTGTAAATATATGTPTGTGAATATVTATGTPAGTGSATVTATVTNTPGAPTSTATATPPGPSNTPTVTRTGTATNTPLPIVATIILGSAVGVPGGTVNFAVTLDTTAQVSGTQNDIAFATSARIPADGEGNPRCTVNPAINKDDTTFAFLPTDCTPGSTCTGVRAVVISFDNLSAIPTGSTLYSCEVAIAADATVGDYPLTCSNPAAGDPDAMRLGADCTNGTVEVQAPGSATIVIGNAEGAPGQRVALNVTLDTDTEVVKTQNDIAFAPQAPIAADGNGDPDCEVNPALDKIGLFAFLPAGCTVGTNCTGIAAEVDDLESLDPIPDGATLYTCQIAIANDAATATFPLTCSNPSSEDSEGGSVTTTCVNGQVVVVAGPTTTATATVTPSTPVGPTATATATSPTAPTATSTVATPPTATATRTVGTPATPASTATATSAVATRTSTPRPNNEDDGCAVAAPDQSGSGWMLLIPAAILLGLRRRRS